MSFCAAFLVGNVLIDTLFFFPLPTELAFFFHSSGYYRNCSYKLSKEKNCLKIVFGSFTFSPRHQRGEDYMSIILKSSQK